MTTTTRVQRPVEVDTISRRVPGTDVAFTPVATVPTEDVTTSRWRRWWAPGAALPAFVMGLLLLGGDRSTRDETGSERPSVVFCSPATAVPPVTVVVPPVTASTTAIMPPPVTLTPEIPVPAVGVSGTETAPSPVTVVIDIAAPAPSCQLVPVQPEK